MAMKIRLAGQRCKNRAFYIIVAVDSHTLRDGKHLQAVGFYDPLAGWMEARNEMQAHIMKMGQNFFEMFAYIWRFIIRNRHISPSPSTPSTLTTAQPQVIKHDVFLSFRGEDTRVGFTSHLYDALKREQILTFIDYQLVRGDEISASLLRTIEEAKLSVIVFSENYASSKWCLEELAKIIERRRNNGQIVIPVFYKVDPSHVRNQAGSFGDAFARLIKKKALTMDKEKSFTDALTDAANLSGWTLRESQLESEFIGKIIGDVLKKLLAMSSFMPCHTMGLFGIDVRVSEVESLLNMESLDVLIVGIWGMGGIGKTTIAEVVCSKVRSRFERIFVENFRQQSDLRRSFLSWLFGQETLNTMGSLSFRDSFVRDRLRRIKVFIVLDDVDDLMCFEEWRDLLDGRNSSFGPGSKVLITSRNKQVLKNVVDETYEVEGLNDEEAIQLFSSKALKNCIPTIDQRHLIEQIARHVQGNPLALIVLGSSLYGKNIEEWGSALNKLAQHPRIEMALRISYDGLDSEQKSIFLDIAHFFARRWARRWGPDEAILDDLYGRSVIFDTNTLIDKCLVTVTDDYELEMHDLLREMAFNIVRAESDFPGERSRLCDLPDVVQVLEENKGNQLKIKGIFLEWLPRHIHLKSDAFAMMDGLRFLSFYLVESLQFQEYEIHLPPTGLEYLPNELRYLQWHGFPSKSLPPSFRAEHLVELDLQRSKLEKLWTGVKDVGNLRTIDLSHSPYLTELPDLSMAKKLERLRLAFCPSLTEVPSSLQYLDKLEAITLIGCCNLRSFPMLDSKVLSSLTVNRCLDLTTCPTISQNMEWLDLEETSINEVPQSVTGKLQRLYLNGCSKMTKFPENLEDIEWLDLKGTAIKEVPSSIQFLTRLEKLDMSGCSKLESLPEITVPMESLDSLNLSKTCIKEIPSSLMKHMISLKTLKLDGTPIKEVPSSIQFLTRLCYLDMSGCSELESLPEITMPMKSLVILNLSKTGIKEMPSSLMKHMISLKTLRLDGTPIKELPLSIKDMVCLQVLQLHGTPIKALPELPPTLRGLYTHDCASLETVTSIINIGSLWDFRNCFKLDQKPLVAAMHLKIQSGEAYGGIRMVLPGSEIPEWFGDKGIGSSVTIQLPSNCHQLKGIAFCLVFLPSVGVYYDFHVKYKNGEDVFASRKVISYNLGTCDSDHMILDYSLELGNHLRNYSGNEVTFKFYLLEVDAYGRKVGDDIRRSFELKSCGVYLHFDENIPADKKFEREFCEI